MTCKWFGDNVFTIKRKGTIVESFMCNCPEYDASPPNVCIRYKDEQEWLKEGQPADVCDVWVCEGCTHAEELVGLVSSPLPVATMVPASLPIGARMREEPKVRNSASRVRAVFAQRTITEPVGHELKLYMAEIGIIPPQECDCNSMIAKMNMWGIGGCRENMPEILAHLKKAALPQGWLDLKRAATNLVKVGWAGKLSIQDLVDEAITRVIAKNESKET